MRNRPTRQAGGSRRTATGEDAVTEITRYAVKVCARCGAPFSPSSGRQRYCDHCRLPKFRQERNLESQNRHRRPEQAPGPVFAAPFGERLRYYVWVRLTAKGVQDDFRRIDEWIKENKSGGRADPSTIDLGQVPVSHLVIRDTIPETLEEALEWERTKDRHIQAGRSHDQACRLAWSEQLGQLATRANDDRWGDSSSGLTMTRSKGSDLRKRRPISTDSRSGGGRHE